ncbi:MAG: hypothetical protein RLZZ385_215 [Pseudomonadota bacterium]|jgi:DNA-binding transcriptional ArsR family regulator
MYFPLKANYKFSALGNELRLKVFRYVIEAEDAGRSAGDIAAHFKVPPSTLSTHLRTLEQAGLLLSERDQQRIIYRVNHIELRKLIGFLVNDCCEGRPELCGLKIKS